MLVIKKSAMKKSIQRKHIGVTALSYIVIVAAVLLVANACTHKAGTVALPAPVSGSAQAYEQGHEQSKIVTVLGLTPNTGSAGTTVIFRELEEVFNVTDAAVLAALQSAYNSKSAVRVSFDPWQGLVTHVTPATDQERMVVNSREIIKNQGYSMMVDLSADNTDKINNVQDLGVINTTTPSIGLTDVVPDMATAQLMFDYLAHQSCELPGPYGVDYCITYQYCEDGCYARAHKMCYVINNRYHYFTRKVFSFAFPDGPYSLCVKAEKWGGCCINWWYHVAPLVNIQTPAGTKTYVFDPAMFDEPVLLATWLHAQQNPACAGGRTPKVTSYNIQPTSAYAPNDTATFVTDPMYADTDTTLVHYRSLISCP